MCLLFFKGHCQSRRENELVCGVPTLISYTKAKSGISVPIAMDEDSETLKDWIPPGLGINHLVVRPWGGREGGALWKGLEWTR